MGKWAWTLHLFSLKAWLISNNAVPSVLTMQAIQTGFHRKTVIQIPELSLT